MVAAERPKTIPRWLWTSKKGLKVSRDLLGSKYFWQTFCFSCVGSKVEKHLNVFSSDADADADAEVMASPMFCPFRELYFYFDVQCRRNPDVDADVRRRTSEPNWFRNSSKSLRVVQISQVFSTKLSLLFRSNLQHLLINYEIYFVLVMIYTFTAL